MSNQNKTQGLLIDLDGTIYYGNRLLSGAVEFVDWIASEGYQYLFLTNNSTRTPEQVADKLIGLGLRAEPEQIMTTALATAQYLGTRAAQGTHVFVVGEQGLRKALTDRGFLLTKDEPEYVIVSLDRNFQMSEIATAVYAVRGGAHFVATNADPVIPTEEGFLPGTGSIVAMVESETGCKPVFIGKPAHWIFDMAAEKLGKNPGDLIMIGDSLETDIKGAQSCGLRTALLMTGVTSTAQLAESNIKPDYIANNLFHLIELLK